MPPPTITTGILMVCFAGAKRRTIAQLVAHLMAIIDETAGDGTVRFACKPDQRGAEKLAACAGQCAISRQSRS